jgi:hypothetical protein
LVDGARPTAGSNGTPTLLVIPRKRITTSLSGSLLNSDVGNTEIALRLYAEATTTRPACRARLGRGQAHFAVSEPCSRYACASENGPLDVID